MLHILGGVLDAVDLLFGHHGLQTSISLILFMYETPAATMEDLAALIIVASADITSTPDLFEGSDISPSISVGCATNYAISTSKNYDNHSSLHF
ncbi:hypothetical protein TNCV_4805481 [Trichonephila clavipes]|nr:hypothetical protein TNCV_4805481 [Trichonephila clavipes]